MRVRELMQARPPMLTPDDTWLVAAQLFVWSGARLVPIVERGRLVGAATEREALAAAEEGELSSPVANPRRPLPPTIDAEAGADEAIARLVDEGHDAFVVVDAELVVGVVTLADALGVRLRDARSGLAHRPERVRDVMTPDPAVASFEEPLTEALGTMRRLAVRHLPVVDGERHVVGMLSDRDLRRAVGDLVATEDERALVERVKLQKVSDVARRSPLAIGADASLVDAVQMLVGHRLGALPVVDRERRLVGILSSLDLLASGAAPTLP